MEHLDSLYAAYKKEFEDVETVWVPEVGFANYSFEDENSIYVQEVFVSPEHRGEKWAAKLTGMCIDHAKETKPNIEKVYTTISIKGNTIDSSIRAITGYGFKLLKSNNELIYFYKELIK